LIDYILQIIILYIKCQNQAVRAVQVVQVSQAAVTRNQKI